MIQSSPSRVARDLIPARSLPAPGSVIAIPRMVSPLTHRGSRRSFSASLARWPIYGPTRRLCRVRKRERSPWRIVSSMTICSKRKSSMPRPPYFSSAHMQSRPCSPALTKASLSQIPCSRQRSTCGATSACMNLRTESRNISWSSLKIRRFISLFPWCLPDVYP